MHSTHRCDHIFKDENTGCVIRRLTDLPYGADAGYFRYPRYLPDGRMLAWYFDESHDRQAMFVDPAGGDVQLRPDIPAQLKFRERDGRIWFVRERKEELTRRALWQADLPDGDPQFVCAIPDDLPGHIVDITCDGATLILAEYHQDMTDFHGLKLGNPEVLDRYLRRPRSGDLHGYDIRSGVCRRIHHLDGICFGHVDTSPADPGLIRFSQDVIETHGQRIWTVRIDGGDLRPIRLQARGEVVTHEFWWSDPSLIGYTYQDRREDPTVEFQHCSEYAKVPTRFGLANLAGEEVFLSDPLNSYHTHIRGSHDGQLLCGEGTDGNSFVFSAPFDIRDTKVGFVPLATIHTPYVPFRGQFVDCAFSSDNRWLVYADTHPHDEYRQLFAVSVE